MCVKNKNARRKATTSIKNKGKENIPQGEKKKKREVKKKSKPKKCLPKQKFKVYGQERQAAATIPGRSIKIGKNWINQHIPNQPKQCVSSEPTQCSLHWFFG